MADRWDVRRPTLNVAAKVSALFGALLWGLAVLYLAMFALGGAMLTAGTGAYVTVAVIIGGLAANSFLYRRAPTLPLNALMALLAVSLSLSAFAVGWLADVARGG